MADSARARKLAKRIGQIVAGAIGNEVKDPRLLRVTFTDTKITGDLHDATLYYTVMAEQLGATPDYTGAAAALESAKGVLRSMVGAGTGVRYTPTLSFQADTIPEEAQHIEDVLARAREIDSEVARRAVGAVPAGEADPYRAPREPESGFEPED
ncbi:MAG: 30S ribosome-binding factor RbfA [Sciscionella sp.]